MMSCSVRMRIFFVVICINVSSCRSWNRTRELEILDNILKDYDRRATPTDHMGTPTSVSVEMFLRSFGSINPATMDYEVDLYLRQSWVDERLRVDNLTHELDLNDKNVVVGIWKPEVYFPNAKKADFQYVTVPNVLVRINPGGNILYMLRLKLIFSCMMNLAKYPLDRQICSIELSSFAKTTRELELNWSPGEPVRVTDGLKLPQFELQDIIPTYCVETFKTGDYSCLRAEFVLERSVGYHFVQSYLPTTMIVIISWVSFWLDNDAIPARVTLGVTTLFTISSESTGIRSNLPPVSYVKALDVWMGMCTTFVFAALIEFTIVNYLFRRKQRSSPASQCVSDQQNQTQSRKWHNKSSLKHRDSRYNSRMVSNNVNNKILAKRIDRACRFAFPLAYLIFNAVYWTYYTVT